MAVILHFDILAPKEIKDTVVIYNYGKAYLKTKGQEGQPLTSKKCRFCLLYHSHQKRKVSYLANEFNVSKATISETIKTLEQKKLIKKEYEQYDTRSYIINLTNKGKTIAKQTSLFAKQIQVPINKLHPAEKENLLLSLLNIINHLNKVGIIAIQRMCLTCHFYKTNKNGQEHFCELLNTKLADTELRIDCVEHKLKQTV